MLPLPVRIHRLPTVARRLRHPRPLSAGSNIAKALLSSAQAACEELERTTLSSTLRWRPVPELDVQYRAPHCRGSILIACLQNPGPEDLAQTKKRRRLATIKVATADCTCLRKRPPRA